MKKIKIQVEDAGSRIDKYLSEKINDLSRSDIQKMIKNHFVLVNDKPVNASYKLKQEDEIIVEKVVDKNEIIEKKAEFDRIQIVKQTDDYLIVNKPAGLIVHGASNIREQTLVDWLIKKFPKIKEVGEDKERPGIVHRLDKQVSGLMIVALNDEFFYYIKRQFQARAIEKKYKALVYGQPSPEVGVIDFPIKRSVNGHKMAAIPHGRNEENSRDAITKYSIEKSFVNYALVDIKIETGRTHQIRVHMASVDNAIVGDEVYGGRQAQGQNKKIELGRIFLYAYGLSFLDMQGDKVELSIEMPDELKVFLDQLK